MSAAENPVEACIREPFDGMTDERVAELLDALRQMRDTEKWPDGRWLDRDEMSVVRHQCAQLRAEQIRRGARLA